MGLRRREEEMDIERMKVNNKAPKNDRPRLRELDINVSTKGAKQQEEVGKRKKGMWKRRGQMEKRELDQDKDQNKKNIYKKRIKMG